MTGCARKFGVLCNYIHSDVRWCDPHAQRQSDYAVVGCLHDAIVAGREKRGSAGHVRRDTPIGQIVFIGNFRRRLARELLVASLLLSQDSSEVPGHHWLDRRSVGFLHTRGIDFGTNDMLHS